MEVIILQEIPHLNNLSMVNKRAYKYNSGRWGLWKDTILETRPSIRPRTGPDDPPVLTELIARKKLANWSQYTHGTTELAAVVTHVEGDQLVVCGNATAVTNFVNGYTSWQHVRLQSLEIVPMSCLVFHCKIQVSTYAHDRLKLILPRSPALILDDISLIEL
jgi:hypothetical protein